MPEITTFLTYNDQAEAAAEFYTSVFPGSEVTGVTRYPDLGPGSPVPAGGVMTVSFTLGGHPFVALNGGPSFSFTTGISIAVLCESQDEVDTYWARFLDAGGTPSACGWLTDHFGVSWQITPRRLIELISDADGAKAGKAMGAMMTMTKIDTEALDRATE